MSEPTKQTVTTASAGTIWHCICAELGRDEQVASDLARQKYQVCLPWTFERLTRGNEAFVVAKLRFSKYVFVGRDPKQSFGVIVDTLHVADYLAYGEDRKASVIPAKVIAGLHRDQVEDFEMASRRVRRRENPFGVGQHVRVPAIGYTGPVEESRSTSIVVRINGWPWRVELEDVEPIRSFAPSDRAQQ